jgi:hypothetical protein
MDIQSNRGLGLPIVPVEVLKKHQVYEKFDTRFRACARLLQALWREDQGLPIGTYQDRAGGKRKIGSLLSAAAGEAGRNFMSPAIAYLAAREVAYQEPGALVDQERLRNNMLSSHPLAFNIGAPLAFDPDLAAKVLRTLMPHADIQSVLHVWFEHSPGRRNPALTGDRTAFDIAIVYERTDGERGLVAIEVKFSETLTEPMPPELNARYEVLAPESGLFREPAHAALRVNPLQQLFREHLLTYAAVARGDYAEATFVCIAPGANHIVQNGCALYASFLNEPGDGQVPFVNITLEQFIEALGWAGARDEALALHQRYCDWSRIDEVVEAALMAKGRDWMIQPARSAAPVALIGKAA